MADDLLSRFVDRKSVADDKTFMVEQFDAIYKEFQKINSLKVTLDLSSTFGKAAGVVNEMKKSDDALATSIQNVNKEFVQLAPVIKNADAAIQQINSGLDESAKTLAELKLRASENAKAQKDLKVAYTENKVTLAEYTEQAGKLIQREQDLKVQIADLTSQQKQFAKENNAVAGSMDQAGIRLGRLREEYRSLTDEEKASPFGKALKESIDALDPAIKQADGSIGNFQRNVGNYGGAFSKAFDVLKADLVEVKNELSTMTVSDKGFSELSQRATQLEEVLSGVTQNFTSVRSESRAFQEAAVKLGLTLGQTDEQFLKFNQAVGSSKREIDDLKAATKFQASDTKTLDGLIGTAQGLAGAYGAATGAAQLFGDGSEDLQKQLNKLAAIMTLLQGLQAIQNALQTESGAVQLALSVKTAILSAAQRVYQATALQSVAATVALRGALILLTGGLAAILLLIPVIASGMTKYSTSVKDAKLNQQLLNDVNIKASEQYADQIVKLNSLKLRFEETNATAKTKKQVTEELNKTFGEYGVALKNADETEKFLNEQAPAFIKMLTLKTQATAALALATDEYKKILQDQSKSSLDFVDTGDAIIQGLRTSFSGLFQTTESTIGENINKLQKKGDVIKKKEIDDSKEKYDQLLKLAADFQNQADALSTNNKFGTNNKSADDDAKKQLAALYELQKLREQAEAEVNKRIANDESNSLQIRLKALQKYTDLENDIIQKQADHEIQLNKLKGNEAALVQAKALQQIQANTQSSFEQSINITKGVAAAFLKDQLEKLNADKAAKLAIEDAFQAKINEMADLALAHVQKNHEKELEDIKKQNETKLELEKQYQQKEKEFAQQAFDFAITLLKRESEVQLNEIQNQIDALDEKKAKDIEVANQTIVDTQQRTATILAIEATANAKKTELEKQQRDIKVKEAKFDKASSLIKVAIDTYEKVALIEAQAAVYASTIGLEAFAAVALAQIPIVIAGGALAAAGILAQPIPQYRTGTKDHPGGLAVLGDGGKKEYGLTPEGHVFETPDKPTVMDLPKHTVVYPDANEFRKAALSGLHSRYPNVDVKLINNNSAMEAMIFANTREIKKLQMIIRDKPVAHFASTPFGLMESMKSINQQITWMNDKTNWSS